MLYSITDLECDSTEMWINPDFIAYTFPAQFGFRITMQDGTYFIVTADEWKRIISEITV